MLTMRVEYTHLLGTHYVVMDQNGRDLAECETRQEAEDYIAVWETHDADEDFDTPFTFTERARRYALTKHGLQPHGSVDISTHLSLVAAMVELHAKDQGESQPDVEVLTAAAWLHDVLEDTAVTFEDLDEAFGFDVACIVDMVTDRPGKSRYERHLNTYYRIREYGSDAVLVKLCDRLCNHARSLTFNERYLKMYRDEYAYFKMALWRPNEHVKLWEQLDNQFKLMKEALDGEGLQERECVGRHAGTGEAPDGAEPRKGKGRSRGKGHKR